MRQGKSGRAGRKRVAIGIDLDWPVKHHYEVVRGIIDYAAQHDWTYVFAPYAETAGLSAGAERFDGIIARATAPLAAYCRRTGTPAVNVWVSSPASGMPHVTMDMAATGAWAARHLLERGFRRFGFVGETRVLAPRRQLAGLSEAVAEHAPEVSVCRADESVRDRRGWMTLQRRLQKWLSSLQPPVGVFVPTDMLARYIADACPRLGLRIPDDIGIVGTGNLELVCAGVEPTLTSIECGFDRVGREAARALDLLMRGRPAGNVLVPPLQVVPRRSTEVFAVDDRIVAAALRLIWDHPERRLGVPDVLAEVPVGRRSLERRFREVVGRSIHDEIIRARLNRAKRLLIDGEEPLKRIAAAAGFADAVHLSKAFARHETVTPGRFRRQHSRKE